ncbi:MAG TPA: ABC transporter permease [Nannocystaceae bacterium]|nr:ABC transporter permease [Nannocystaceae bacterium]
MRLRDTVTLALAALLRNKMRSLLTTLGVVIGVAAVIIMQSLGLGATARVTGEIASMGSNMLVMMPGGSHRQPFGGSFLSVPLFTQRDIDAIEGECDAVRVAAASNTRSVNVVYGDKNRSVSLYGVTPEWFEIRDWGVSRGRLIDETDVQQGAKRCLIGQTLVRELFGDQDPLGAELRLHDLSCEVIGVMVEKGTSTFGADQDDIAFMPYTTFVRRITGDDHVAMVMISTVSDERTDEAKEQIEALMRQRRHILPGEDDDFNVRDMRELQSLMGTVTGVLTTLLASVAAVSLVVGGIGIMNIMLVSVTERTREIGIRMAVGARGGDILQQFLLEAIVLAALGGAIGIVLGLGASFGLAAALGLPFTVPASGTAIAFAFALAVGVVFGVFPARKAARLRPIEALRFE